MPRYVMIGSPLPSHIFHLGALGRELKARGHTVTMVGLQDVRTVIEAEEVPYCMIGKLAHPLGEVPKFRKQLAEAKGITGLQLALVVRPS
jgi:zeaxanthin glucosyltransferase